MIRQTAALDEDQFFEPPLREPSPAYPATVIAPEPPAGPFTRLQREVWRAATLASLCGAGLVIIWIELVHRVCL